MSDISALKMCHSNVCAILLQQRYNEWRKALEQNQKEQPSCVGYIWDCALKEARESFAEYIGAVDGVSLEVMLHLEMRYEEEMTGVIE